MSWLSKQDDTCRRNSFPTNVPSSFWQSCPAEKSFRQALDNKTFLMVINIQILSKNFMVVVQCSKFISESPTTKSRSIFFSVVCPLKIFQRDLAIENPHWWPNAAASPLVLLVTIIYGHDCQQHAKKYFMIA